MGQPGLPRYFLGGEPTLNPGTNFTQGCLRKTFLPRSTHWHRNRFSRKSQKAAWLVFSFAVHSHTHKTRAPLETWSLESRHLPLLSLTNGKCWADSIQPAQSREQAGAQQGETLLKKWRASTYRQSEIITLQPDLQKLWEPGKIFWGEEEAPFSLEILKVCVKGVFRNLPEPCKSGLEGHTLSSQWWTPGRIMCRE